MLAGLGITDVIITHKQTHENRCKTMVSPLEGSSVALFDSLFLPTIASNWECGIKQNTNSMIVLSDAGFTNLLKTIGWDKTNCQANDIVELQNGNYPIAVAETTC